MMTSEVRAASAAALPSREKGLNIGEIDAAVKVEVATVDARLPRREKVGEAGGDERATTAWTRRTAGAFVVAAAALSALLAGRDVAGADSQLVRVDVEVALRNAVELPDPAARRALLAPFVDVTPAAAVVAARAALERGDRAGALALLEQARARDPGLPVVHQLLVALARQGLGDLAAREADARRYGVDVP